MRPALRGALQSAERAPRQAPRRAAAPSLRGARPRRWAGGGVLTRLREGVASLVGSPAAEPPPADPVPAQPSPGPEAALAALRDFAAEVRAGPAAFAEARELPEQPPQQLQRKWGTALGVLSELHAAVLERHGFGVGDEGVSKFLALRHTMEDTAAAQELEDEEMRAVAEAVFGEAPAPLPEETLQKAMLSFLEELAAPGLAREALQAHQEVWSLDSGPGALHMAHSRAAELVFGAQWRALARCGLDSTAGWVAVTLQAPRWAATDETGIADCLQQQQQELTQVVTIPRSVQ
eukprot:TRINITY_DN28320_c0_g1_i1.p2 TRINITY_DN28320_c0_g1~~TRINITY_DN28320_c0_g1_i1.p2  ORF type:complete len:292 (+),score=95.55 TRINITY_DN28320_c0_g1_i1:67-942(+)